MENDFLKQAFITHGKKYKYDKVSYVNNKTKVCIICPEHGEFWQTPHAHLRGQGCPKCGVIARGNSNTSSLEKFIDKALKVHGDRYDYSKAHYINAITKICIVCPEHGEFWQTPHNHLKGYGCCECGRKKSSKERSDTVEAFIDKARRLHEGKYDYSKVEYVNNHSKVDIICPKHGVFQQLPYDHLVGKGCPMCSQNVSHAEEEIVSLLGDKLDVRRRDRNLLGGKELDIYLPSLRLGIEYNGLRWHSEQFNSDRNYHLDKLNVCNTKGVRLLQIFEDEWEFHKDIVVSKLLHIANLSTNKPKIYGRKCVVGEITHREAKSFLDKHHIQSYARSSVYLGAKYDGVLCAVMTFIKEGDGKWELNRFATDIDKCCIGLGGKLFSYFVSNYKPTVVKSFADRRWTDDKDNLYEKLGFILDGVTKPDYRYVVGKERVHKFSCRKKHLMRKYSQYSLTEDMTEAEMAQKIGLYKIWDCGLLKYKWTNKKIPRD